MTARSTVLTAAITAAAALTATGSTFTSAATNEPPQAAPVVQKAAAPAPAPARAPKDRGDAGRSNEDRSDNEDRGGNDEDRGNQGRGNDEGGDERRGDQDRGHGGRDDDEGRIHLNERTYSASPGGCVSVASGLGSTSFNIFNDSRRTVEVFSGATCDNGAPVATVGPHGSTEGVFPNRVEGGVFVSNGVGGSFRVIENDHYDY